MHNGQTSSASAGQGLPVTASAASATSQTAADLDWLLKLWSNTYAEEHGTTIEWIAYKEADIDRLLPKKSELSKSVYALSIKALSSDVVRVERGPEVFNGSVLVGDFELAIDNHSGTAQSFKRTLKRTTTQQSSTTWTTSITTTAGFEFGGGVPLIASTKATLNLALAKSSTESKTDTNSEEHSVEQPIIAQAWKKVFAAVYMDERRVTTSVEAKVELTGGVVICCGKKISMPARDGTHHKGYVSIQDVFQHLQSYVNKTSVSARDREKLRQSLSCFELDGGLVKFTIRGEVQKHWMENATVKIREEDIPRPEAQAASATPPPTAPASRQSEGLVADVAAPAGAVALVSGAKATVINDGINAQDINGMTTVVVQSGFFSDPTRPRVLASAGAVSTQPGGEAHVVNRFGAARQGSEERSNGSDVQKQM